MTLILTNPRERSRFIKFSVVGVFGAVVDFGAFNLLTNLFKVMPVPASVLSFVCAIINNFLWNRFWIYPDSRSKSTMQQIIQFSMISVIGLVIRTPLFAALEGPLVDLFQSVNIPEISFLTPTFLGHNIALAFAVIVVMFWNFFVNRYWTYNDVK